MTLTAHNNRSVARPVSNLGNTCFMNAILQALAHAPELLLAMDCESHRSICPIAAENATKRQKSPSTSPEASDDVKKATRKSKRHGGKSPDADSSSNASDIQYCALCEVEKHIEEVHDTSKRDKAVVPSTFVDGFVDHIAPWFQLGVQEDSHEFLRLLIDAMQKSCLRARVQDNPQDVAADNYSQDEEYPFSLFRGTVESIVTCASCGASSSTRDPIEDVGLEVTTPQTASHYYERHSRSNSRTTSPTPANTPLWDVKTAFKRYASKEELDSGYKCEKCGKVGRASKQSRLASIPPILTLHLKRFRYGDRTIAVPATTRRSGRSSELSQLLGSGDGLGGKSGSTKIEGHVKFDMIFDLSPYMTDENSRSNMFCRLFAVIVHAGKNSNSGHYIAFVRDVSKNEWWKMDDSRATPVSQDEVLNAEAYMLFYRLVNHPVVQHLAERRHLHSLGPLVNQQSSPTESTAYKKRSAEVYSTGEEWARKVNFPPNLICVVQKISDLIANDIRSSPRYHASIREELLKSSKNKNSDTTERILSDVVVEGTETYKRKLCELFYKLRDHPGAAATVLSSLGGSVEEPLPAMEAGLL